MDARLMNTNNYAPTARLRWVDRVTVDGVTVAVLQQFWAPDLPAYMANEREGEWRDVECVTGTHP